MIAGPSVAQAATVLGQTCVTNDVAGWSEDRTPMQNTVSTGNQYTAAAPGVITSWSSQANATASFSSSGISRDPITSYCTRTG